MAGVSSRREFFRRTGLVTAGVAAGDSLGGLGAAADGGMHPWARAEIIAASVRAPRFPHRSFDLTRFGAAGDGVSDCSAAFKRAIDVCAAAGGGHVVVPAGRYLSGPIHLRSNVDLHVTADATIAFSQNPNQYLPAVFTRWEGTELYNYSPLIYAFGQHNIGITGAGTLDGQADNGHWWPWKGSTDFGWRPGDPSQAEARATLQDMAQRGVPVEQRTFGAGGSLRPNFIQPYRCHDVVIEGVTIINSPMWEIHPVLCHNVLVHGVTVDSHGPNNDGCDPESCRDVVIRGCTFDTGDDCVAIKSGRNADGRRVNVPSERILVQDCVFRAGHGGVTVGSEMSGGVRDIFARNLTMSSPELNTAVRFKTNSLRGGFIHDVHTRDITVGTVAQAAIVIDFYYEEGPGHGFNPDVRTINISHLTVDHAQQSLALRGYPNDPIHDITLTHVNFQHTNNPALIDNVDGLTLHDVQDNGQPIPGGCKNTV